MPQAIFGLIAVSIGLSIALWILCNTFIERLPEYTGGVLLFVIVSALIIYGLSSLLSLFTKNEKVGNEAVVFSGVIDHSLFSKLRRGWFGYSGEINIANYKNIEVSVKGRSEACLNTAIKELSDLKSSLKSHLELSTEEAFSAYEVMKDLVESGELDLDFAVGEFPEVKGPEDVWGYMFLEEISVEPEDKYIMRLSFQCMWDIEHDFGIYISNNQYQYSGVSV